MFQTIRCSDDTEIRCSSFLETGGDLSIMNVDRTVIRKQPIEPLEDDGYVQGSMKDRVEMVWDITVAIWEVSTRGKIHTASRRQRHVAVFRSRRNESNL